MITVKKYQRSKKKKKKYPLALPFLLPLRKHKHIHLMKGVASEMGRKRTHACTDVSLGASAEAPFVASTDLRPVSRANTSSFFD